MKSTTISRSLLALLFLFTVLGHMRWGSAVAAWLSWVVMYAYLIKAETRRELLAFGAVYAGAIVAATVKIITDPLPLILALPVGLPIALFHIAGALLARALWSHRSRVTGAFPVWAPLIFALSMCLAEWAQGFSPIATWGAAAYTQLHNLPLLQTAAFTGMFGVSFLLYFSAAGFAHTALHARSKENRFKNGSPFISALLLIGAAQVYGANILEGPKPEGTVRVATVNTTGTAGGLPLPDKNERAQVQKQLLLDTRKAVKNGAKVIVWNEAANVVLQENEAFFVESTGNLARELRVHLIAAIVIPSPGPALAYENKYFWFRPDGSLDHTYFKHFPAPGEPIERRVTPLPHTTSPLGVSSGAICYDYDYPSLAQKHGKMGADFVALPSSDWLGIDPIHTEMTRLRAIESGVNIVRSTRFGLSAAMDARGRFINSSSSFTAEDRIMYAQMPVQGVRTFYGQYGDWFICLCGIILGGFALGSVALRMLNEHRRATSPSPHA